MENNPQMKAVERVLIEQWCKPGTIPEDTCGRLKLIIGHDSRGLVTAALADLSCNPQFHLHILHHVQYSLKSHLFTVSDFIKALLRHAKPNSNEDVVVHSHCCQFILSFLNDRMITDVCLDMDRVRQERAKWITQPDLHNPSRLLKQLPAELMHDMESKLRNWAKVAAHALNWCLQWLILHIKMEKDLIQLGDFVFHILNQPLLMIFMIHSLRKGNFPQWFFFCNFSFSRRS
jgi:hypothetical protein